MMRYVGYLRAGEKLGNYYSLVSQGIGVFLAVVFRLTFTETLRIGLAHQSRVDIPH